MRLASYLESNQSKKAADKVIKRGRKLGFLLYMLGIIYMFLLPNENFNLRNFFDENALMAGLVRREYADLSSLAQYSKVLSQKARNMEFYMDNVADQLSQIGLEVYSQNFSARKPVTMEAERDVIHGRNVYGILRAKRAQSIEAIVLSAPYRPEIKGNAHGAATMVALAKYFKDKPYWAKDLIFLVTSHGEIGMQAWVDQYMGVAPAQGVFGPVHGNLPGRSGAIQAAIHLELPSPEMTHVNVLIEGQNGALPNLDLVNVIVYLCHTENIKPSFHSTWEWLDPVPLMDHAHLSSLFNVLSMAGYQAPGLPFGPHSQFIKHRIDSLTVRGVYSGYRDPTGSRSYTDMQNMARVLEGTFRSVNNLLETLHHSEFFYFTAAVWRFISIGRFMPLLALLLLPLVLEALSQWLQARSSKVKTGHPPAAPPFPFGVVVVQLVWSYGCGLIVVCCPLLICHFWPPASPQVVLVSLIVPMVIAILLPLLLSCVCSKFVVVGSDWRISKFFSLIMCLVTLMPLGMLNFSLAVITSLLLTYPAILATPYQFKKSRAVHFLSQLVFLLLSPPAIFQFLSLVYLLAIAPSWELGTEQIFRGVAFSFNSWQLLNCWGFPFLCVGVWPLWLMSWTLTCQSEAPPKSKHGGSTKEHQD